MDDAASTPNVDHPAKHFRFLFATLPNPDHPDRNEDTGTFDENQRLAAVFDGVGGAVDADKASRIARDVVRRELGRVSPSDLVSAADAIERAFGKASTAVRTGAPGSLTACVAVTITVFDGMYHMVAGNVGDSRLYLFRNGVLTLITRDDSPIPPEFAGKLDDAVDADGLSSREREAFGVRHIMTQALGQVEPLRVHTYAFPLKLEDTVILTTDGVHNNLTTGEIEEIAATGGNIADRLVKKALHRSQTAHFRAKHDDATALSIHFFTL